jgi:prophage regulatory protein
MKDRYIRADELTHMTGLSLSTIWRLEQDEAFPRRRSLGLSAVGWLESEISNWLTSRPIPRRGSHDV